jgi:hypothetical protein
VKRITLALLLATFVPPAAAQETEPLTPDAAASIIAFYNDPATTRLRGPARIAAGATVDGAVASMGGPLVVAGRVRGDVVVINGDLVLLAGALIEGSARVVGGRLEGVAAAVEGGQTVYHSALRFRREGDRLVADPPGQPRAGMATWFGRTDLVLTVDGSYNRVEGLPIAFGPRVQLRYSNPTVIDARVIYRTRSGLRIHPGELGHDLRVEQYLGGHRGLLVGAGLHGLIDPIEEAGLSDRENSLATFILHRDYRDHYTRDGWSAYLRLIGTTRPYDARIEYRDEKHGSIESGTPWSLLQNDRPWRPQPQVARGNLRSVRGAFRWDSRNDPRDPADGWLVAVEVEQGVGGTLRYDQAMPMDDTLGFPGVSPRMADSEFTAVSMDARRYMRLGPRSRLAVRAAAAGAPDRGPLPPQRQHQLGAEGGLPGYPQFSFDCGARDQEPDAGGFYPYYGCDRMVLLQAEYRFALLTEPPELARRLGVDFDLFATPELVLFANAGRAWIEARGRAGRSDLGPRRLQPDAGIGLRLGPVGLYIATPLTGAGHGPNFFVRLGPRL